MAQSAWFGNPSIAFKLLVLVIMWQGAGSGIMIFYANFMDIPQEIMEACRVDGCTEWQRFTRILSVVPSFLCFYHYDEYHLGSGILIFLIFWAAKRRSGRQLDFASMVFYRYTFEAAWMPKTNLGFGSAISVVMFLFMLVVTFLQNKVLRNLNTKIREGHL